MNKFIDVKVPDIGDFKNIPVIEVLVKPGDAVVPDDILIVLESEKAALEVPASVSGIVGSINVAVGDRVSEGAVILTLDQNSQATSPAVTPAPSPISPPVAEPVPAQASVQAEVRTPIDPPVGGPSSAEPHASPSLRRFARELGVDLAHLSGSGLKGRITHVDVRNFVKTVMAQPAGGGPTVGPPGTAGLSLLPWPEIDFAKYGPIERTPLSKIRKISGANLARNWVMIPHVTNFDEADITELEAFRKGVNLESGAKLTMLAFLIKATDAALKKFPNFNASLDGDELVLKLYRHIGFAADTPNGLVVPVIKDVERKGVMEIAAEAGALAGLARDGKLKPTDMQGGCFTVSSLGGIGGTGFTPIINAPEIAILGVTRAQTKPVWDGQQFQPRLILPLCLSWDHRVIDGAAAARFLAFLSTLLHDFRRISL